ncbi:hypothetical protein [Fluviicola sp.]|uniref:hypothetical protein n=1 Tax=Fluviicola sp. TaxID=1917219 RepID=UPI0031D40498
MKIALFLVVLVLSFFCSAQEKEQPLKNLFNEYYISVNHGIGDGSFGGGLGLNHVFHPDKIVSFRTGLDFQYFSEMSYSEQPSHFGSPYDYYCSYVDLTVPIVMRINIKWVFIELGGNLAVGIAGQKRGVLSDYSQPLLETTTKDSWNPGFSVGPVLGIGARIPMNEKLDLLIRPDVGASISLDREFGNLYGRLCVGIHLK